MKNNNQTLLTKNKEMQSKMTEQSNTIDSLKSQLEQLSQSLRNRDSSLSKEAAARREAEIQIEKLQVKIDEAERALESNKPAESENSQLEALRVCFSVPWLGKFFGLNTNWCYSKLHSVQYVEADLKTQPLELVVMSFVSNAQKNVSLQDLGNVQTVEEVSPRRILSRFICNILYHQLSCSHHLLTN